MSARAIEPKSNEKKPAVSEQTYHDLADHAATGMTTVDLKGRFTYVNQVMADFIGHPARDLIGRPFKDYIHPEDRSRITSLFLKAVLLRKPPREVELRAMGPEGSVRHLLMRPWPMRAGGKIISFSAVMVDVTERKQMEERLKESEEQYRELAESITDMFFAMDRDLRYTYWNKASETGTGISAENAVGKNLREVFPPSEERKRAEETYLKAMREQQPQNFVNQFTLRNREYFFEISAFPTRSGVAVIAKDITERKRMEDRLRASEERYRSLVERMHDALLVFGEDRRIEFANRQVEAFVGYKPEEIIGERFDKLLTPEGMKGIVERYEKRRRGKPVPSSYELQAVAKDGTVRDFEISAALYTIDGKNKTIAAFKDITERKRMEKELRRHSENLEKLVEERTHDLRESEEKFRGIAERSFDMIVTLDPEGRVTYASPAVTWVTGYTPEEIVRQHFQNYLPKDVIPEEIQAFVEIAKGGVSRAVQLRIVRKDGSLAQAEVNASPIIIGGKIAGVQAILRDVTERYEIERIRDRFISAVTHELRTPLVSIKGYVDLVLDGSQSIPEEVESRLQVAKRNTDRLLSLVNDLLDVQRMQAGRLQLELQPTDFNKVVDSCMTEIHPLLEEKKLSVEIEVPDKPIPIQGDQVRLCQVLMNLLSNAAKFSPEGSDVTLRVKEEKDTINVQVSDKGIGIRKEDLARVFEPFSAIEKPTYVKGTGLGLSITKGIVEAHGGKIWAESEGEGQGATFTFTLPKQK
ncbi:PAS domain S-box protein [Candidatus Bathyarchaeota archaeon]|nr:PAS domain S-box protein [Candidatus Bathyarchaeota archaeon]